MRIECFSDGSQITAYADRPEYKISLRFDKINLPQELSGDHICEIRSLFQQALQNASKISIVIEPGEGFEIQVVEKKEE